MSANEFATKTHYRRSDYQSARGFQPITTQPTTKNLRVALIAALCLFPGTLTVAQTPAQATPGQHLKGHVTAEMMSAPLAGRVPPTTQMTLTVGLIVPNASKLLETAAQIADPASPSYRKYLTPEQFADQFGATVTDYQSVLDWAQANHLTVTAHRNRFVATVEGSVAEIESALSLHLNYHARKDGTQFFAPDAEPTVALSVPIEHIGGLDNFDRRMSAAGSGANGSYQGTDFRNAYAPGMTERGGGQKIGIFMADGFAQSDIDGYAKQAGQSFQPVQVVPANTALKPGLEGTLDIEAALSMAPTAQVVAFVGNSTAILANMSDRHDIKQFSSSWFWYNGTQTDVNLMLQLGTQGQSFFQASGDGGAYPIGSFANYTLGKLDCRQFPSVTIVGGTSLDMSGNGASYGTLETAWANSSGGVVPSVGIPSYQLSLNGHDGASKVNRNVPDVSAQAADMLIFYNGAPTDVAGTSEATPLWAGFMALVNELAANGGASSVGFANPALYSIGSSKAYWANFHDVVSGIAASSDNVLFAGPGYDLVTGFGSPQHTLIYTLSGVSAYPLYCQGPLVTSNNTTPFNWAKEGANAASPGPGQCTWSDRAAQGSELNADVISGILDQVANLPKGKFGEIGVYLDPNSNQMVATQVVGLVKPPFSSSPTLP
jgi:xanthomonalisin